MRTMRSIGASGDRPYAESRRYRGPDAISGYIQVTLPNAESTTVTRATYRFLDAVPASAEAIRRAAEAVVGEPVRVFVPAPGQSSWVGRGETQFVYLARDETGRERNVLEAERLAWAARVGIRAPRVTAADPGRTWLATARVPDDPPMGPVYVGAALQAADRIAAAPAPEGMLSGRRVRRAPRWSLPVRLARMAASPIDVREFAAARRNALALPADALAHGDFHPGNVLFDAGSGTVNVTDWENLGMAPPGTDQLALWCGLETEDDREMVMDHLLTGTSLDEREGLLALRHWLALRTSADIALTAGRFREPGHRAMLAAALDRVREARRADRVDQ